MRSMLLVAFGIILVCGFPRTFAQTPSEEAWQEYERADQALNVAYKALVTKMDQEGKQKLQAAQRAWIRFRDAEAEALADDWRGGSARPMIYSSVRANLTEERTAQLKARMKDLEAR